MDRASSTPGGSTGATLLRLVLPVYLPVLLVNGGVAMLVPVLPLYLRSLELSYSTVGAVLATAGVGAALAQVPAGELLRRRSETEAMIGSVLILAASVVALGATGLVAGLLVLRFVWGIGSVGWLLSRQSFLTRTVGVGVRGRAMSLFGGTTRLAFLLGPLLGGWAAARFGYVGAFWLTAAVTLCGLLPLLGWRPGPGERPSAAEVALSASAAGTLRGRTKPLLVAGVGQLCVMAVREGRFVVLPLVGASLELDASEIGALVAVGGLADLVLFPVSGLLMDRLGRLYAIVPSFALLGGGLFLLASAGSTGGVTLAAIVMGVGNGLGSGTMLTLSSDLAPAEAPSRFLALMGSVRDSGKIVGPIAVGTLADAAGLGTSALVLGGVAYLGIVVITLGVGETRGLETAPAVR